MLSISIGLYIYFLFPAFQRKQITPRKRFSNHIKKKLFCIIFLLVNLLKF